MAVRFGSIATITLMPLLAHPILEAALEEEAKCFDEVVTRFVNSGALAADVVLRTERRVPALFALDNGGQTSQISHASFYRPSLVATGVPVQLEMEKAFPNQDNGANA